MEISKFGVYLVIDAFDPNLSFFDEASITYLVIERKKFFKQPVMTKLLQIQPGSGDFGSSLILKRLTASVRFFANNQELSFGREIRIPSISEGEKHKKNIVRVTALPAGNT